MTTLFDAGDFQRLDREARLTEQLPRQPIMEDRSPEEEPLRNDNINMQAMFDGMLMALTRRLQ